MTDAWATTAELEALRNATGIPELPTQLTFEARMAISGSGPRAYDWSDKPHRVVYDLCREIEKNAARIKEYEDAYRYALHLAEALRENFPPNPDFRFLGELVGLLTQIDNMVAGLSRPAAGGGDSYEDEAVERAVENILTNPSLTLDPDQRREDRDERARLAREDDQ